MLKEYVDCIGMTYDDPEGTWEIVGYEDGGFYVKQVHEGDANFGKVISVFCADALYYLRLPDGWII